jgi:hypothetical protein
MWLPFVAVSSKQNLMLTDTMYNPVNTKGRASCPPLFYSFMEELQF